MSPASAGNVCRGVSRGKAPRRLPGLSGSFCCFINSPLAGRMPLPSPSKVGKSRCCQPAEASVVPRSETRVTTWSAHPNSCSCPRQRIHQSICRCSGIRRESDKCVTTAQSPQTNLQKQQPSLSPSPIGRGKADPLLSVDEVRVISGQESARSAGCPRETCHSGHPVLLCGWTAQRSRAVCEESVTARDFLVNRILTFS